VPGAIVQSRYLAWALTGALEWLRCAISGHSKHAPVPDIARSRRIRRLSVSAGLLSAPESGRDTRLYEADMPETTIDGHRECTLGSDTAGPALAHGSR